MEGVMEHKMDRGKVSKSFHQEESMESKKVSRRLKSRALELVKDLEKSFGKGSAMVLTEAPSVDGKVHSTGSINLDEALGIGGLPTGRVVEIYGPESSGKTTLCLSVIAGVQKQGGIAAFVDAEHALDSEYAARLGVDLDELIVSQPDYGEQALEIVDSLVRSEKIELVVVDSVAALVPRAELEGQMGDSHVGLQARLMSQALRKLTSAAHRTGTTVIFINQLRQKIGVTYGSSETTTGGNALKFYSSVRLDVRRRATLKTGEEPYGNLTKVKVVKNKMAPPFKIAEFELHYGRGINREGELLDRATVSGVVEKSGSWYAFGEQKLGQGRLKCCETLRSDRNLLESLKTAVMAA
jgi:recombination protein RecA